MQFTRRIGFLFFHKKIIVKGEGERRREEIEGMVHTLMTRNLEAMPLLNFKANKEIVLLGTFSAGMPSWLIFDLNMTWFQL